MADTEAIHNQAPSREFASLSLTPWRTHHLSSCNKSSFDSRITAGTQQRRAAPARGCLPKATGMPDHVAECLQSSLSTSENGVPVGTSGCTNFVRSLLRMVIHRPIVAALLALPCVPLLVLQGLRRRRSVPSKVRLDPAISLLWFRNDLRLHDHEALYAACKASSHVLPVYVFDPRDYGQTPPSNSFARTGPQRARFILQSVADLRTRLQQLGSDLIVRVGWPEEVLPSIMASCCAGRVYCHTEASLEEGQVERAVCAAVSSVGGHLTACWGGTLVHLKDLPFSLQSMPSSYGAFKELVAGCTVRPALPQPTQLQGLPGCSFEQGQLPALSELGFAADALRRLAVQSHQFGSELRGGETQALQHLAAFIAQSKGVVGDVQLGHHSSSRSSSGSSSSGSHTLAAPTAGGVLSRFACRVSPWLSLGCLSPRQVYDAMQQHPANPCDKGDVLNTSCSTDSGSGLLSSLQCEASSRCSLASSAGWLELELLWRDFFRFITKKHSLTHLAGSSTAMTADATPIHKSRRHRQRATALAGQQAALDQQLLPA